MSDAPQSWANPSNIPIPDPSVITEREIAKAKNELRAEIAITLSHLRELIDNRAAVRDKVDRSTSDAIARVPDLLNHEITGLREWTTARLDAAGAGRDSLERWINEKFRGIEALREQAFTAQKEAVAAQNYANSAAIAKSENATTKALDSLDEKIALLKESLARDIGNLNQRLDRGEGLSMGVRRDEIDRRNNSAAMVATISGVVGFLVLLATVVGLWLTAHSAVPAPTTLAAPAAITVTPLSPPASAPSHP